MSTHLIEVVVGKDLARMPALDTRTADEDADLVTVLEDLGDQRGDLVLDGEVGRVDPGLATELLDGVLGLGGLGVALDEDDVCAGLGQGNGDGLADAPGAAGDKGCVAFEGE